MCATAVPAVAVRSERFRPKWPTIAVTFSGSNVVVAESTAPRINPGGFTVFRTDTFRLRLSGDRLTGGAIQEDDKDIVFRTSAGRTSVAALAGDTTGRYVVIVKGAGFPPQVVYCCTSEPRDLPLEADGRLTGPVAFAATLDGPVARYVMRDPSGAHTLISSTVSDSPGQPFTQRIARPLTAATQGSLIAMAPGLIAIANGDTIRLTTTPPDAVDIALGPELVEPGVVTRLHATRTMIVALVRTPSGLELARRDAPSWTRKVIWRGTSQPPLSAVGDRTVVFTNRAGVVTQSVPGATRQLLKLRGTLAALATDGRRVAVAERRTTKGKRRTAIVVASVLQPPGAYAPGGTS